MSPKRPPPPEATLAGADLPDDDMVNARTTEIQVAISIGPRLKDRPVLVLVSGVDAGRVFSLDHVDTLIGRAPDCGVRIDDVGISRRHARVRRQKAGAVLIEDLGSTNGVYVNGERMDRGPLASGDQLQIGPNITLRFSMIDPSEEALARQLFDSSTRDALTRAFNRKYLMARLNAEVAYAARHRTRMGLILFDLDHFKKTNDTHGHIAGDTVLHGVAAMVARLIRTEDVFARYGGEEFVVLVRGIPHSNVARFAERMRKGVAELSIPWTPTALTARISVGVASLDEGTGDLAAPGPAAADEAVPAVAGEGLLKRADARLYRAKEAGRDRVVAD